VSYRDDRDADQAHIAVLEGELAAARRRIAELEGRDREALVVASAGALTAAGKPRSAAARWLGAPVVLELTRTFDHAFPSERLEDLLTAIRRVAGRPGHTELLRTSLTWRAAVMGGNVAATTVAVSVRDGKTTLVVGDRLHQLAGGIYGGVGGGVGGGGVMVPVFASVAVPVLTPVFFVVWFGGVFAATRALFKRAALRHAQLVQRLFDTVAAEIEAAK
jgi:hypothetical protein